MIGVISVNTLRRKSRQLSDLGERKDYPVDSSAIARLSTVLRIPTISFDSYEGQLPDSLNASWAFDSLLRTFRTFFPKTFEVLQATAINEHSLLLHWKGKSREGKPGILYAHLDVVPAGESPERPWSHDPFGGVSDDRFVYGRGAIDDKGSAMAILEAVERLIRKGFTPAYDVYIAFGHDEEDTGLKGAGQIAAYLKQNNIRAEFVLDEGGLIATDMVPFVKAPVALVATSEKGYMTVELSTEGRGGHSSYPSPNPPVERIAGAIERIHEHPFPRRMSTSVADFMDYAGPEMDFPFNAVFANRWLFKSVVFGEYEKIPSANAMIRTTAVTTMIDGGVKENAIPARVWAKINVRILPGDSSAGVLGTIKSLIDDSTIVVRAISPVTEPSVVSSTEAPAFKKIQEAIHEVFPDVVVAPTLLIGQTDSRHFREVTDNIYRFLPVRMTNDILDGLHGSDEKIGIGEYLESIEFYYTFLSIL